MKKLFTLTALLLLMAIGASAQEKKTWDFTQGLSPETVANLNADAANWTPNGTDADGNTNNWQNAVKPSTSEELKANGEVIAETAGLRFDIGNNKSNSIHLATTKIRLTRANTTITFPQLKSGQKITIVGRSANGSATDRGIAPVQDYITLVDGVTTDGKCIFVGNQVEGSLGTYSFTWEVQADGSDPVDVQFKLTPNGGIDFTLFMIDQGDEVATANVAYVYNGTDDVVLNYLKAREGTNVSPINIADKSLINADAFQQYDVTVIGPNVDTEADCVQALKEALPWTPVLNLNADIYNAWGYGEAVAGSWAAEVKQKNNTLLKDVELMEADGIMGLILTDESDPKGVKLGDYFAGDVIVGVSMDNSDVVMIHTHNINHNGYVFLPYADDISVAALKVIDNAIATLQGSKREISAAAAPTLSMEYKDMHTLVTIKAPALPKAKVYYTTDGSEPTTESTLYTDVIDLYQACTVRAAAIAEGYTLSSVSELVVDLRPQPTTPVISYEQQDGKTIVALSGSYGENDVVWYNFEGTTDTVKSARYAEPFTITMPQNVTAFAVTDQVVWSEVATERVLVKNPRVVIDVAAHFSAPAWDGLSNGSGLFSGGKNATSMYDTSLDPISTTVDPETGDEVNVYPELPYDTKDEPGDNPQWTIMSKGQAVLWQNNGASTDKVGTNEGGYYPEAAEDISSLFPVTKNDIQFSKIYAGERANAAIQSKNKYQAPLDIVVIANMEGGPILAQVSADGENWQTVGDEIEKTGWTRMWKMYTRAYDGNDEVYVRVAQETGGAATKIFDIYIANQGEQSQALLDELNRELAEGISEVLTTASKAAVGVYSLSGMRQSGMQRGLNIVVGADGMVRKVMVK